MSQAEVAERVGVTQGAISRIEAGSEPMAGVGEALRLLTGGDVTWSVDAETVPVLPLDDAPEDTGPVARPSSPPEAATGTDDAAASKEG